MLALFTLTWVQMKPDEDDDTLFAGCSIGWEQLEQ